MMRELNSLSQHIRDSAFSSVPLLPLACLCSTAHLAEHVRVCVFLVTPGGLERKQGEVYSGAKCSA